MDGQVIAESVKVDNACFFMGLEKTYFSPSLSSRNVPLPRWLGEIVIETTLLFNPFELMPLKSDIYKMFANNWMQLKWACREDEDLIPVLLVVVSG